MTRSVTCASLLLLLVCLSAACDDEGPARATDGGSVSPEGGASSDGPPNFDGDSGAADVSTVGACDPRVQIHTVLPAPHISPQAFDAAAYNSNPPSSGPHCVAWGQYATFSQRPLPRCNYVHNLEHGAIVLLHNCPGGCADATTGLANVARAFSDPTCSRPRVILTSDADLVHPVAAAAWGATFTAACLDDAAKAILEQFMRDHYNKAPEDVCAAGSVAP